MRTVVMWAALLALLAGCRAKPPKPVTVADLQFPVAVDYGSGGVVIFKDAAALGTMSIGRMHAVAEPGLVDSTFAIYTLKNLASTHHWLWLMINPTGSTPVTFTLERAPKSGLEAARALFRTRLDEQTWRQDLDEQRRALAAEKTLTGMVGIVNSQQK